MAGPHEVRAELANLGGLRWSCETLGHAGIDLRGRDLADMAEDPCLLAATRPVFLPLRPARNRRPGCAARRLKPGSCSVAPARNPARRSRWSSQESRPRRRTWRPAG